MSHEPLVLLKLGEEHLPLSVCLTEGCRCVGVFYREIYKAEAAIAVITTNEPHTPKITLQYRRKDGVLMRATEEDLGVVYTYGRDVCTRTFRPDVEIRRRDAVCLLTVGSTKFQIELRTKPSNWLLVKGPVRMDFLNSYPPVKTCVFGDVTLLALETRSMAGPALKAWLSLKHFTMEVSWAPSLNHEVLSVRPFCPGSGWKLPGDAWKKPPKKEPVILPDPFDYYSPPLCVHTPTVDDDVWSDIMMSD